MRREDECADQEAAPTTQKGLAVSGEQYLAYVRASRINVRANRNLRFPPTPSRPRGKLFAFKGEVFQVSVEPGDAQYPFRGPSFHRGKARLREDDLRDAIVC